MGGDPLTLNLRSVGPVARRVQLLEMKWTFAQTVQVTSRRLTPLVRSVAWNRPGRGSCSRYG